MVHHEIRQILLQDPELAHLVGNRITPSYAVKEFNPTARAYIVFEITASDSSGILRGKSGVSRLEVNFECYAPQKGQAYDLAKMVMEAFDGYFSRTGIIRSALLIRPILDQDVPPVHGENVPVFCCTVGIALWVRGV